MCGIAGIISKSIIDKAQIKSMTDVISHRGPDGEGHWLNDTKNVALGHRRLSILDLSSAGAQPMLSQNAKLSIVFNGEIYNYIEIRNKLLEKGYCFHSESDTEVLLNLYQEKGVDCLQDLDGMFAFAIWDDDKKVLFCARDRFGEKPFFYNIKKGKQFSFASEMKALWTIGVGNTLNFKMVDRYFNDKYYLINPFDISETFYKDILRLEPAHYLLINENCEILKKEQYWSVSYEKVDENISFEEAEEKFRSLFFTSIERRLRSDVPVGSSLSGGLDSSSIVCAINELNKKKVVNQYTFSARFPGYIKDESKHIDAVLNHIGVEGFSTFPNEDAFLQELSKFMYHQEEPVAAANQYAQWEVMKLAKQNGVTVLLDGQGADETITGYDHYFNHYFEELSYKQPLALTARLEEYNQLHNKNISPSEFSKTFNKTDTVVARKSISKTLLAHKSVKKVWYQFRSRDAFFSAGFLAEVWPSTEQRYLSAPSSLSQSLWNDTFLGGLETLLRYGDRNSMAFSREVRLPFLYHELVDFLFTLPSDFKINKGWSKYLLRKSMENYLPAEIAWRKDKIGYEPPQQNWFEKPYMKNAVTHAQNVLEKEGILNRNRKGNDPSRHWQTVIVAEMLTSKK